MRAICTPVQMIRTVVLVALLVMPGTVRALETILVTPGASDDIRERIAAGSLSLTAEQRGFDTPQEILAAARSDYQALVGILYDSGYYSPVVSIRINGHEAANIPLLDIPKSIRRVEITVTPGPLFRFGRAEIAPLAPGTILPEGFRTGQPAPTGVLQQTANAAVSGWRDVGHAKARVEGQTIVAYHQKAILDAQIRMDPGARLTFGTARVIGNKAVRTDAILRISGFPTGEVFDPEQVRKVARRLRRTGTFTSVSLREAETANPNNSLDYDIEVSERLPRRIGYGVEISSEQGLDLQFNWTYRNVFGGAERLRFESAIGNIGGTNQLDGMLRLRLDRPAVFGPDNDLFYLGEIERLDEDFYNAWRAGVSVGIRREFSDELTGEIALAAVYTRANDVFGKRNFTYIGLPGRIEWDKRDNKVSATRGFFIDARALPYVGFSDTASAMQLYVDNRGYLSLGQSSRVVLAGRVQIGSVVGAPLDQIPPDLLFYSGGAGTVRGQPYQSLGVAVPGGTAGGRSFLGLSGEIRGRITQRISLVGFYDFGAVDSGSFVTSDSPNQSGAGFGVRYDVGGVGAIRVDFGWPVSGDTGDGLQFYIGIGQAF